MPRKVAQVPALKLHKGSGQGYVRVRGKSFYFGAFGAPGTVERYQRWLSDWFAVSGVLPGAVPGEGEELLVAELAARYVGFTQQYYGGDRGRSMRSWARLVADEVIEVYGGLRVSEFGPLCLQGMLQYWERRGLGEGDDRRRLSRNGVNKRRGTLLRMFKWGVSTECVGGGQCMALQAVRGVQKGRSTAPETVKVGPVGLEVVWAMWPWLSPPVWGMVQLQLLTGARPGEVVQLRKGDVVVLEDGAVGIWTLDEGQRHKGEWRGKERLIFFGPRALGVVDWLGRDKADGEVLCAPADAFAWRSAQARSHRRPNQRANPRRTKRALSAMYDVAGYRRALKRAAERAGVEKWGPHRLRHARATMVRAGFGLEAAQVVLGHEKADVTQVYAQRDIALGLLVMREIG